MALDTYANLQTSIAGWLNRADLTAAVPDYITLAEAQISRRLLMLGPVRRMMKRLPVTVSSEYYTVPDDFMGARSIYLLINGVTHLKFCTPDEIDQKKGQTSELTGNPEFFSVVGSELQLFPAPATSMTGEMKYWQRIPALTDAAPTNWMLAINPDAYLYGPLLQSAPYLKDDARVTVWGSAFETILSDICAADRIERDSTFQAVPVVPGGTP